MIRRHAPNITPSNYRTDLLVDEIICLKQEHAEFSMSEVKSDQTPQKSLLPPSRFCGLGAPASTGVPLVSATRANWASFRCEVAITVSLSDACDNMRTRSEFCQKRHFRRSSHRCFHFRFVSLCRTAAWTRKRSLSITTRSSAVRRPITANSCRSTTLPSSRLLLSVD